MSLNSRHPDKRELYYHPLLSANPCKLRGFYLLHETLNFSPDAIEAQLGHRVPDRLGSAYNRSKHLDERTRMMQAWADYLDDIKGK